MDILSIFTDMGSSFGAITSPMNQVFDIKSGHDFCRYNLYPGFLFSDQQLQQACQFHQVATSLLRSACCNLSFADLLQLVETTCDKRVEIINL